MLRRHPTSTLFPYTTLFRSVRLRAAGLARVVERGRLERHEIRRLERHPVGRERMLDRLVLADRPVEYHALLRVPGRARHRAAPQPDELGGDQDALRIHAVQDVLETLAFLADAIGLGHRQRVEEHLVRVDRVAAHLLDLAHLDVLAVEVRIEERQPGVGLCQQQHLLRDLRGRNPDLLPRNEVLVAAPFRFHLDLLRVQPGVGLSDGKASALLPGDERRKPAALLLLRAEYDDRIEAEDVHVHRRGAGEARARLGDRLHHHRRLGDAEPRAAVGLGHRDTEPAVARERLVKVGGESAFAVALEPVIVAEALAELRNRLADALLLGGERKIHLLRVAGRRDDGARLLVTLDCLRNETGRFHFFDEFAHVARAGFLAALACHGLVYDHEATGQEPHPRHAARIVLERLFDAGTDLVVLLHEGVDHRGRGRRAHDLGVFQRTREVEVVGAVAADDDAMAFAVDFVVGAQGRVFFYQIGALDLHVRGRLRDLGGARRVERDEGDVPAAGLAGFDDLAGGVEYDELHRHAETAAELARQIDRDPARIAAGGVARREDRKSVV